ncbi:MAG: nucleotide exchange factor GrpE [Deltaproteobacteria bacterium]|nr:nucleotide exchange factor GrpE [Deltaproteobacteria bacterium]
MVTKVKINADGAGGGLPMKKEEQSEISGQNREAPAKSEKTEDLMAKLQEAEKKAAENYDKYVRAVADLDNYRKRAAKEKSEAIQYGCENLLRDVLPVVDGMDRALEHACKSDDFEAFRKGLKLLQEQFLSCLQKHGVEKIDTEGKEFDPNVHEAMMQVESADHGDSEVVGEFQKGYLLKGRLLRPAKVSVCKRPPAGGGRDSGCEEIKNT